MRPLTLDSVLVATDLSDADLPALRTAIELARLAGAQLHVVHVAQGDDPQLEVALEEHIRAADPDSDLLPGTTIRPGQADRVISDVARRIGADVIVLGPHGRHESRAPGGTAYRVAAGAERPCLVLPGEMQLPLGRILVPIDTSGAARGALAVAMTWASALRRRQPPTPEDGTALVVLHVEKPENGRSTPAAHVLDEAMVEVNERVAGVARVRVERAEDIGDNAAATILKRAATDGVDLIVIGTRGGVGEAAELGSVSSAVVQETGCPLLLVPPRVWREQGGDTLS
jgi:nucleotide-binding universal stress UspA family protein